MCHDENFCTAPEEIKIPDTNAGTSQLLCSAESDIAENYLIYISMHFTLAVQSVCEWKRMYILIVQHNGYWGRGAIGLQKSI